MNPVGVHHRIETTKHSAMKISSQCGPGRKLTRAGS
jgi:hypothetical protein